MPCLRRTSLLSDRYPSGLVELTRDTHNSVSSFGFTAIVAIQVAAQRKIDRTDHLPTPNES